MRNKTTATRTCIVSQTEHPQTELIRFVLAPDGTVVPDLDNRLPGKGAWVKRDHAVLTQLSKKNAFSAAFKQNCRLPDSFLNLLETLFNDRIYMTLAVLRRTGAVAHGFENARKLLQSAQLCVYLCAAEPDSDSRRTLEKLTRSDLVLDGLDATRLGQVFGQDAIAHVAVAPAIAQPLLTAYHHWRATRGNQ